MPSNDPTELTREEAEFRWNTASTFEELCELTALFIEGKSPYLPGYGAEAVDSETSEIADCMAALNRAGFLTTCSQPGELKATYKQRAFVVGFARKAVALRLAKLCLFTDLLVSVFPPERDGGYPVPVTVDFFQPFTWVGEAGFEELTAYTDICSDTANDELEQAWYVSIIDLTWGRREYLWSLLTQELCYSVEPHPNLALGTSYILGG